MSSPKMTFRENIEIIKAVQTMGKRDRLLRKIESLEIDVADTQEQLRIAIGRGDEQNVTRLHEVRERQEKTLPGMRIALVQCEALVENMKPQVRDVTQALHDDIKVMLRQMLEYGERMRQQEEWERGQQWYDLPGFRSRLEPGAMLGFLGASMLFFVAVTALSLWLR